MAELDMFADDAGTAVLSLLRQVRPQLVPMLLMQASGGFE
jgi:hypothetical protein